MLVRGVRHQAGPGSASGLSGFALFAKTTNMNSFTSDLNSCVPALTVSYPEYASVDGSADSTARVLKVLSPRTCSEVDPAVVEPITVDVIDIYLVALPQAEQQAVQAQPALLTHLSDRGRNIANAVKAPTMMCDQVFVSSVNDGVGTDRAVFGSQGDTDGILKAHRASPVLGVRPGVALTTHGPFAFKYTTGTRKREPIALVGKLRRAV